MFNSIKIKIKKRIYNSKISVENNCKISNEANIDKFSTFEGHNKIENSTISKSSIGFATYVGFGCMIEESKIGKYCSIANNVSILIRTHPSHTFVSTHPVFYLKRDEFVGLSFSNNNSFEEIKKCEADKQFSCIIGNDVWIGNGVKIMGGVEISDGAIIGAGAVVTKNVPPYAIVGGVPARIIRYRFKEEQIEELLRMKWWNKSSDWLQKKVDLFSNIEKFIGDTKWK